MIGTALSFFGSISTSCSVLPLAFAFCFSFISDEGCTAVCWKTHTGDNRCTTVMTSTITIYYLYKFAIFVSVVEVY